MRAKREKDRETMIGGGEERQKQLSPESVYM